MPEFDVEKQPIYLFEIEDTYLFKYYFERTDIFAELQEYYDDGADGFEALQEGM